MANAGTPGVPGEPSVAPYIPDYASLIKADPTLIQNEADLRASDIANLSQRNAAFQRDVIGYGKLPDLADASKQLGIDQGSLASVLDPATGKLAEENTTAGTSTLARLNADNTKAIIGLRNALAARGIYNSGETGYQLGQQNQAYTNSQFDAAARLLDAMAGQQGSYLSAYQQLQMALASARESAAGRIMGLYPPTPGYAGTPGTPEVPPTYYASPGSAGIPVDAYAQPVNLAGKKRIQ